MTAAASSADTFAPQALEIPRQAGIYVRRMREFQNLTRRALAERAGVSERLLASLELGDATGIRLDKLLQVLDALGLGLQVTGCPSKETLGEHHLTAASSRTPNSAPASQAAPRRRHASKKHSARQAPEPTDLQTLLSPEYRNALYASILADQGIDFSAASSPLTR